MDGLLGYPRQPIVSRPPDAVPRLPSRLSQDSLHQLERRVKEPVAACKASRVRSWIQDLSISTHQNDLHELAQGTSQLTGRCGHIGSRGNAAVQGLPNLGRTAMGTAMPPPNPHIPVIDLTEPLNKRLKLSDHSHLSSQPLETKPQPLFNSTVSRRVPTPQQLNRSIATSRPSQPPQSATTATIAVDAPSNSVAAQHSAQKNLVIDLTDQKAKGLEKGDIFKTKLKDVFPDMCEDYIQTLYVKYDIGNRSRQSLLVAVQNTLDEILAKSSYPKKQTPKKRKQMDDTIDNNDLQRIRGDQVYYFAVACKLLQKHFTSVPQATVQKLLMQYKTFLKTYIALHYFGRPVSDASEYWRRLHNAKDKHPPLLAVVLEHELREAKRIISEKEDVDKKKAEEARERIIVEEHRRAGTLAECQCCFTEVLPDRTVPCDGVIVHLFCNSCIKQRAEVQVGLMQYELKCFDTSGCQAGFNRSLIRKVIGDKLMKRLEDLQQQDEIAKASIDGLEECPFCEFKAICPPVEENKEFTCLNSDCEKVSCRLCKEETHIPQTCEEARKERGLGERHAVEEAMTAALVRKCPQCGLAIVKEDGCNKLTCRCGTLICDVCKKDISKDGYSHFKVGKCALHEGDTGVRRRTYEVMQAEKAAVAKAVQDGKIDPEILRVTTDSEVNMNQQVPAQPRMPINRPRPVVPQAQMPQLLQMPQIIQYQGPQVPPTGRINRMPQVPQVPQVLQIPRARLVPQVATPTILQAAPILGFNPRARLAQMPDLLRIPDLPMMTMRAVPQTQARQAPPAIPSVQHPQSLLITQPRNTTTTTVAATPIPVQLRRHQSYGQAPQPQVIPPPPPMLQRTNSTPTLQARQQQLNHQYQHSMRRRSGNHPTNP